MLNNVYILPDNIYVCVESNTKISDALAKEGINVSNPCGGQGTCGKCMVLLDGKPVKCCTTDINSDVTITIPDAVRIAGQQILTDIRLYDKTKNALPLVQKVELHLEAPTLEDSVSDTSRLIHALSEKLGIDKSLILIEQSVIKELPHALRKNEFHIHTTVVYEKNGITVLSISPKPVYGVAIDIGTTTMVTALCNLETGEVLDNHGISNPQALFGADVISRVIYTEENADGTETLQNVVLHALNQSIELLAGRAGIATKDILVAVVAANTAMSHFLLGIPTDFLRREPYVPAAMNYPAVRPVDLDLHILPTGRVIVLPSISSYVGGDIVAGVIATEINKKSGLNLLVDVGTNGEIVLAGEGFMLACSCSAGPAFEGSGISCGSRAVQGAIDNVVVKDGELKYDVLKNAENQNEVEALSICGSGLIALLSALLEADIINRSGKFNSDHKIYSITDKVSISEPDIQNLIRAKGAVFAGIRVLTNSLGLSLKDLDYIQIAGGFGRSIHIPNAISIGMLPLISQDNYSYVGNSSLAGALRVLNDRTIDMAEIALSIVNLELSIGNEFMDEFVKACFLPHTDFSLFDI